MNLLLPEAHQPQVDNGQQVPGNKCGVTYRTTQHRRTKITTGQHRHGQRIGDSRIGGHTTKINVQAMLGLPRETKRDHHGIAHNGRPAGQAKTRDKMVINNPRAHGNPEDIPLRSWLETFNDFQHKFRSRALVPRTSALVARTVGIGMEIVTLTTTTRLNPTSVVL